MLNRRHLRVKVLQSLYAYHQSRSGDIKQHEKNLLQGVDKVYEMYIWMLSLITEVTGYAEIDAQDRANKHLPTADDLNADVKILSNRFILSLRKNKEFLAGLKKYKVAWDFEPELVKTLFSSLKKSEEYAAYLSKTGDTLHSDKDIIKHIFKKIILKSSLAEQVFEDMFIYWPVDKDVLQALIAKTFKNFAYDNPAENKLAEVTGNWEEFLNFPSIPVKVTINEYLEISKEFSTPKSNSFINGILDKILIELKSENKINKIGRGLIEE